MWEITSKRTRLQELQQCLALHAFPAPSATSALSDVSACTGSASQKGRVMGILRSLGALARALGPILSATGECGLVLLPAFADIQCHSGSPQPRRVRSAACFQSHKVVSAEVGTPES